MYNPKVAVVILNWKEVKDTIDCLNSVYNLDYKNFEVILVDNGSLKKEVDELKDRFPKTIFLTNKINIGYTGGNNRGIQLAIQRGAEFVWLLNNDTVVEKGCLTTLVEGMKQFSNVGMMSPIIYYFKLPNAVQYSGSYIDWKKHSIIYPEEFGNIEHNKHIHEDNICLWGTALLVRKELIQKIGLLNEKYFAYWEDTEYSIRSIRAGFKNFINLKAKIYHKKAPDEILSPGYYYYMARNEYLFWNSYLKGFEKINYFRQFLAKRISQYSNLEKNGCKENAEAVLRGVWDAFNNRIGKMNDKNSQYRIVKKIIDIAPRFWIEIFSLRIIKQHILGK